MIGKLVIITGLDGSGTSSLAEGLCKLDPNGILMKTPGDSFEKARSFFDDEVRLISPSAHYLYYLASVVYASEKIKQLLHKHNVYCVRYLIDTVVSHRVAGMDIDLTYDGNGYSIHKPDVTLFITIDEAVRQNRITTRGKSILDKVLDDENNRRNFLVEFNRYENHYVSVENNTDNLQDTIKAAASHINGLK